MPRPSSTPWLLRIALATLVVGCGRTSATVREPGLRVERVPMPTPGQTGETSLVTFVYLDPAHFELELLTAQEHGDKRTPEEWAEEFGLTAAINASMYLPNLRSAGFMVDGDRVNNEHDNRAYGGFLAFDPVDAESTDVVLMGRDCDGFDLAELRRRYRVVLQSYRLLDCARDAIAWRDPKHYSAAAIGVDTRGWLVLIHSGSPCRMSEFSRWLAEERQDLTGAIFVEGGPQAGLYVRSGAAEVREVGAYEGVRSSRKFRPIPNVVGARPRR